MKKRGRRSFKIELPGWPQIEVLFYRKQSSGAPHRGWVLKAILNVPDSRTGEPEYFSNTTRIEFFSRNVARYKIAHFAKAAIVSAVKHEIEELLLIDGRRAFKDPHAKKKRARA